MPNNVDMGQINWVVKASAKEASEEVKKLSNNIGGLSKVLKAVNFAGFIASCKRIGTSIFNLVAGTGKYIQTMNLFKTVMGDSTEAAEEFINKAETLLGLDPEKLMSAISAFQRLGTGFGIDSNRMYTMSKNLTQLASDMTATGLTFEDAVKKLKSGISGELEPMRAFGVALDQATLQELAYSLGINKRVQEMTRAQKTELAYYQIMKSTTSIQGMLSKTLVSPSSALRMMQTEFKKAGRALGSVFVPIIMKAIPYVRALTQIFTELAQKVAAFFGYKLEDYTVNSGTNIVDYIEDIGDEAEGTTKALNKMLMPFDELNNINFNKNGSGVGSVGTGGSLGLDLLEYDMFGEGVEKVKQKVDEIKDKFKNLLDIVVPIGAGMAAWKVGSSVISFLDKLGVVNKTNALKLLAGLTLSITGIALLHNGVSKMLEGDFSAENIISAIAGGAATIAGSMLLFGKKMGLGIGIALTLIVTGIDLLRDSIKRTLEGDLSPENLWKGLGGSGLLGVGIGAGAATLGAGAAAAPLAIGLSVYFVIGFLGFQLVQRDIALSKLIAQDMGLDWNEMDKKAQIKLGLDVFLSAFTIKEGPSETFEEVKEKYFKEHPLSKVAVTVMTLPIKLVMKIHEFNMNALKEIWGKIKPKLEELVNKIKSFFGIGQKESKMNDYGQSVMNKFISGFTSGGSLWSRVKEKFTNFVDRVKSFFGIGEKSSKMNDYGESVMSKFISGFTSGGSLWSRVKEKFTSFVDRVKSFFGIGERRPEFFKIGENLMEGLKEGIKNIGEGIANLFKRIFSGIKFPKITWELEEVGGVLGNILEFFKLPRKMPKIRINWEEFAEGGFPENGQLFIANEAGPELVGNIGNRTAVANQKQITEGIAEATYSAISRALAERGNSGDSNPYFVINVGDENIYKGYAKKKREYSNMFGITL